MLLNLGDGLLAEGNVVANRDVKGKQELQKFPFLSLQALNDVFYEGSDIVSHLDNKNKEKVFHQPGQEVYFLQEQPGPGRWKMLLPWGTLWGTSLGRTYLFLVPRFHPGRS